MGGWRPIGTLEPAALSFVAEPWPRYWTSFDLGTNVLLYMPLGAMARRARHRYGRAPSFLLAAIACSLLSLLLEWLQTLVPGRIPANTDWIANSAGAAFGAALAAVPTPQSLRDFVRRNQHVHPFAPGSAAGLAVLAVWLLAQMHPHPIGFATGQIVEWSADIAGRQALADAHWRIGLEHATLVDAFVVAVTILALGALVQSLTRPGVSAALPTVALLLLGLAFSAGASLMFETRFSGIRLSAGTQAGIVLGAIFLVPVSWLSERARLRIFVLALTLATLLVNLAPHNAYHSSMVAAWDRGRWVNFAGGLEAIAALWPVLALAYALMRLRRPRRL
ncbi:MAG: VanZ family protein [Burkholderiaceae bacterium]